MTLFEIPVAEQIDDQGMESYRFQYLQAFLDKNLDEISPSFPKSQKEFLAEQLFPLFAGLLPEGNLKKHYCKIGKIEGHDEYGLLLFAHSGTAGALDFEILP